MKKLKFMYCFILFCFAISGTSLAQEYNREESKAAFEEQKKRDIENYERSQKALEEHREFQRKQLAEQRKRNQNSKSEPCHSSAWHEENGTCANPE